MLNTKKNDSRPGLAARLRTWIDQRTGVDQVLERSLDEPIPGGARFAYVFGSGLLFIFLSQVVTGICLALYYVPAPTVAHTTVAYIVKEVSAGSFLRSLHSYGSSAMIVVLVLHFLQTILYGSYKGKRQILWISGCVLALFVLAMAFTGYILPWTQSAYSAGSVGTDLIGQIPLLGEGLRRLLRGGASMGALTLSRFYVLHILVIPALLFSFVAAHILLFRKAGAAGPVGEDPVTPRLPTERFYPKQVLIDMTFVLLVMGALGMLAYFVPVTLGLAADPSNTTYLPRPEWYFLPMFQWLKYWEGWRTIIGVFVIPLVLGVLVFALPFLDRGSERRPWRRPIPVGAILVVLLGMTWLGMKSRLEDSRDPAVAAQLAQQRQQEEVYFHAPFQPYSASSASGGASSAPADATVAEGKSLFDSHECSKCHGAGGVGAKGPPLTHIATKYPGSQFTALLKAPTAGMKAGGMTPLTLNDAQFTALDAYVSSLGGTADGGAPPSASLPGSSSAAPSEPPTGAATAASAVPSDPHGESVFKGHDCAGCHGAGGIGTSRAPALTKLKGSMTAAALKTVLEHPTHAMQSGGMPAVKVSSQDMDDLVGYLRSLGAPSGAPGPQQSSPAKTGDAAAGKMVYAHCALCHGLMGKGDGEIGRVLRLVPPPTDFTTALSDDAEWLKMIEFGSRAAGKSDGMKGFADELTHEQIRDVLAYVETLRK